ncbi:tol-pal system-associated acyl-CoA thioesterase [Paracoccus spongiarum]|uniref:Tol-pal system-associated acyl-CoA thioesterase n=1 Tax=Paracoccus spongiarum TaxID=3064387 RepID=A0ABT9JCS2_9RHOB|nr:tol-pal system-associated acyl-CoA thioesterase [Paracoccus sp. 2205BS29-5]MDP5307612.1 tol-pal system-associated acyl-CoA thioesterase [Paracoccus sp. 2205BS29-5]
MPHRFALRVYYEDTDLAGIVYYANYLKFIERARSEWLRDLGVDQAAMKAEGGQVFAVRRVEADYLRPARFDDLLTVTTDLAEARPARVILSQSVLRGTETLFAARVTIACLDAQGRPTRLPPDLAAALHRAPPGGRETGSTDRPRADM